MLLHAKLSSSTLHTTCRPTSGPTVYLGIFYAYSRSSPVLSSRPIDCLACACLYGSV